MKKQQKQLIAIVILLIVCVGTYIGVTVYNNRQADKEADEEAASTIQVTEIDSDDVAAFSYEYEGETLAFEKDGDTWVYTADKTVNIDQDVFGTMLDTALGMTAAEEVTDYESLDDYGVNNPSQTVTITAGDTITTLQFGDENTIISEYYLLKEESLYLVDESKYSAFQKSVADLTAEEDTETEEPAEAVGTTETVSATEFE